MKSNLLFKVLCSLPIILITLYFIPFLGICLILLRYFIYANKKNLFPLVLIGVGFLILVPKILNYIFEIIKFDVNLIPLLKDIVDLDMYNVNFINYSKYLICVGIIFLILSFVLNSIIQKINSLVGVKFKNYINEMQKRNYEISKKNDMEIKLKQERAKNTIVIKCSNCGGDNILSGKVGVCKYCRSSIENDKYKL